ncbi:MAG: hypothetical protein HFG29_01450 [Eubacterium sp.]|nr:hypothetical protein [Eubacterium sp.]
MNFTSNIIISGNQAVEFVNEICSLDERPMNAFQSFLNENASAQIDFSSDCLFEVEDFDVKSPSEIRNQGENECDSIMEILSDILDKETSLLYGDLEYFYKESDYNNMYRMSKYFEKSVIKNPKENTYYNNIVDGENRCLNFAA